MVAAVPVSIRTRAYNVGFGDAVLLTFSYDPAAVADRPHRHMLIDCGTTKRSPTGPHTSDVIAHIAQEIGERLDVLVVTHRHADHLSAFAKDSAALRQLKPRLLIRPWADDPVIAEDAIAPTPGGLDPLSRAFVSNLNDLSPIAGQLERWAAQRQGAIEDELAELAALQVKNARAVAQLQDWAGLAEVGVRYVKAGDRLPLQRYLPGVRGDVLGPPTLKQVPGLDSQADNDPDEFWLRAAAFAGINRRDRHNLAALAEVANVAEPYRLGAAHELIADLAEHNVERALSIVRSFDTALNNTSVVMLLTAGARTMLFSGDAQIENWRHILGRAERQADFAQRLADLDLYKIGHHGSRNATPKTFWAYLRNHRSANLPPVTSLMSTLAGFHGKKPKTKVPSVSLMEAFKTHSTYVTTEDLTSHLDLTAVAADRSPWTLTRT